MLQHIPQFSRITFTMLGIKNHIGALAGWQAKCAGMLAFWHVGTQSTLEPWHVKHAGMHKNLANWC